MNKNIIKLFAILVMCFMIGSVLVACGAKQGEQGEQGAQGAPGAEGPAGPQGPAGESAFIGSNGNWWVGDTDTGVKAEPTDLRDCENHDYTIDEEGTLYDKENKYVLSVHTQDSLGCTMWVCVDCGDTYLEWVDHNYVPEVTAPTCVDAGYTTYTCSCGLSYVDDEVEALGHKVAVEFDADNVDTTVWTLCPNTTGLCACVADPVYSTDCTRCDEEVQEVGKAAGHVWGEYELAKNTSGMPDCEWVPVYIAHCTVCESLGAEHDNCIDADERGTAPGHKWDDGVLTKPATCTEDGVTTYTCTYEGCNETKTENIPTKEGHTLGAAADCENDQVCTKCGYVAEEAHGHKFDTSNEDNYVVDMPSVDEAGSVSIKCVDCGKVVKEIVLPALNEEDYEKTTTEDVLCADKDDIYTKEITVDENNKITITVTVNGNYVHTEKPAKEDCRMVEGQDKWYYVYKCGNCGLWIVAYYDAK